MRSGISHLMNELGVSDLESAEQELKQAKSDLAASPGDPDLQECCQMLG